MPMSPKSPAEKTDWASAPLCRHILIVYHDLMVFRRRKPATLAGKLRAFLWPRKGFSRGLRYLSLRVLRLSSSPHSIAVGVAAGAATAATPFIGLHLFIAIALAYVLSGNLIAAALSTVLANPLTIPFILAATYETGAFLLGIDSDTGIIARDMMQALGNFQFAELWQPVLKPMLIGCLPLAAFNAVLFYALAFRAARLFRMRRRASV